MRLKHWSIIGLLSLCAWIWVACSDAETNDVEVSSETHWMRSCQDGDPCAGGGQCLCGICTLPCNTDTACNGAGPLTACANENTAPLDTLCNTDASPPAGICLAPCQSDSDCLLEEAEGRLACVDGLCAVAPASSPCLDDDGDGVTTCEGDCDDTRSDVGPNSNEICGDTIDNDCDGATDEECSSEGACDDDDSICAPGQACIDGLCRDLLDSDNDGIADTNDNCPDVANPAQEDVNGNSIGDLCDASCGPELCFDSIDNNCDGVVDEAECLTSRCVADSDCDEGLMCINSACQ